MPKKTHKEKMRPPLEYLILGFLCLTAIILGFAIYKKMKSSSQMPLAQTFPSVTFSPSPTLPADETAVLHTPSPNATEAERKQFFNIVAHFAKEADVLDITGCKAVPIDLKVKLGNPISVKNSDAIDHKIVLNPTTTYTISANSTQDITIPFEKGPGIYGFGCDTLPTAIGMFFVTNG